MVETLLQFSDFILLLSCIFILLGSVIITIKTRFIQLSLFKTIFNLIKEQFIRPAKEESKELISPSKALFTAMSTTLGISTIVGPVIAIHLGGPGALLFFLLVSFFGSAATYVEVDLSLKYRKKLSDGTIMGGPMQYLAHIISPGAAKWYAICCLLLMITWSGAQANQLAAILDSPILQNYRISPMLSGGLISLFILAILIGGIKRISSFSAKLVPLMFVLYIGGNLWILFSNLDKLIPIFHEMLASFFSPVSMASGAIVGGITSTMRWGIFKGVQTCEAGIGTQAIPHTMADTQNPAAQGTLAMLSTFTAGLLAFLSGCVALITQTWQSQEIPLGINMVVESFQLYFSTFGVIIVIISTFLFGFGTILGNSYNGSQCYGYLTNNKRTRYYLLAVAVMIFIGSISEVKTVWSLIDLVLAAMSVPHMAALLINTLKQTQRTANKQQLSLQD